MVVQVMQPVPMPKPFTLPDILQTGLGLGQAIQQFRAYPQLLKLAQQQMGAGLALKQAQAGAIPSEVALRQAQMMEALSKAQKAQMPAGTQEFQKAQGKRFSSDLSNVSQVAQFAKESEIPRYTAILNLLSKMQDKTGPGASLRYWGSSDLQKLTALITQSVFDETKNIHLGRWTQVEVQWLKQAIGNPNMMASTLQYLFSQKLAAAQNALTKQKFYYDYRKAGGTDPDEVAMNWAAQKMPVDFGMPLRESKTGELTAVLPGSPEEAATQAVPPSQPGFFERLIGGALGNLQMPLGAPQKPSIATAPSLQGLPQQMPILPSATPNLTNTLAATQRPAPTGALYSSVLGKNVTQEDIDQTARESGETPEQIKAKFGIQ